MTPRRTAPLPIEEAIDRALALHRAGKHDRAEPAYRAVLEREPEHPRALHLYGMYLHEHGDTAGGIACLERACAVAPDDVRIENNLAGLYLFADRTSDAERLFTRIVERSPDSVPSRFNLGVLFARSGRWADAVTQLEIARALVVDFDVLRELGDALGHVNRLEDAARAHREALANAPDDLKLKAEQAKRLELAEAALASANVS